MKIFNYKCTRWMDTYFTPIPFPVINFRWNSMFVHHSFDNWKTKVFYNRKYYIKYKYQQTKKLWIIKYIFYKQSRNMRSIIQFCNSKSLSWNMSLIIQCCYMKSHTQEKACGLRHLFSHYCTSQVWSRW